MSKITAFKGNLIKYYPYFIFPLILLYLLINIFDGNNGLLSHKRLDTQISIIKAEIEEMKKDNELFEVKISSLNSSDNTDLIDEQLRSVMGYGKNNEFVIYFD